MSEQDPNLIVQNIIESIDNLHAPIRAIQERMNSFLQTITEATRPFAKFLTMVAKYGELAERLKIAGFLPHESTPFQLVENYADDPQQLKNELEVFYTKNWNEVRDGIKSRTNMLDIDHSAISTFIEALEMHEKGYYKAVCRLLFPEIEKVARIEFYKDDTLKRIASLNELRETSWKIPVDQVPGGMLLFDNFKIFAEHLYEHVDTVEDIVRLQNDPIPNRHATIHGYIEYGSQKNSLNTIFMTEYIFQLIHVLKTAGHEWLDEEDGRAA